MSIQQIESELPKLTPEELDHVRAAIDALRKPARMVATPQMLAERRRLMDEVMKGEWSADLPPWQETRALDKAKDPWNT